MMNEIAWEINLERCHVGRGAPFLAIAQSNLNLSAIMYTILQFNALPTVA
jgi:hypothetical protein